MRRSAQAVENLSKARRFRWAGKDLAGGDLAASENLEATQLEAKADELLKPAGEVVGAGEALDLDPAVSAADQNWGLIDSLKDPDSIGLGASDDRLNLIADAGVLETALDAAHSMRADANSPNGGGAPDGHETAGAWTGKRVTAHRDSAADECGGADDGRRSNSPSRALRRIVSRAVQSEWRFWFEPTAGGRLLGLVLLASAHRR